MFYIIAKYLVVKMVSRCLVETFCIIEDIILTIFIIQYYLIKK